MRRNVLFISALALCAMRLAAQAQDAPTLKEYGWRKGLYAALYPVWQGRDDYFEKAVDPKHDYLALEFGDSTNYSYVYLDLAEGQGLFRGRDEEYRFEFRLPEKIAAAIGKFDERNRIYDGTAQVRDGLLFALHGRVGGKALVCASYTLGIDCGVKTKDDPYRAMNKAIMEYVLSNVEQEASRRRTP